MIHTFWLNLILITVFQFSMFGFHYPKVDIKKKPLQMNKTNGHNIVIDWNFD